MELNYEVNKSKFLININKKIISNLIMIITIIIVSFLLSNKNYILFHTIIQIFTFVIAFSTLIVSVNTYSIFKNKFFMFLGIGYGIVGVFDVIHTITYPGIDMIGKSSFNISLQSATMALYLEVLMYIFSYKLVKSNYKRFNPAVLAMIISAVAFFSMLAIFNNNIFPDILDEFYKPTRFWYISQITILILLFISAFLFYKIRLRMGYKLFVYLEHSLGAKIIFVILSVFLPSYSWINVMLHVAKLMSFYYIYKALIDVGLKAYYDYLYQELHVVNEKLMDENKTRKAIEEALMSNEECFKLLIDNSKEAIIVYSGGQYTYANSEALNYLGVGSFEELRLKSMYEFVEESQRDKVYIKIKEVFDTKKTVAFFETKIKTVDQCIKEVETAGVYFVNEGKPAMLAIIRDIDYRKQVKKLKEDVKKNTELLNESREYNRMITDFISNISHELRTPLNVILSAVQVLNLKGSIVDEDKRKKYLDIMKQNCYRLLKLVNNFIDISKIDSGYMQLNLQNHNIVNAVENITLSITEYVENKGVSLIFDTDIEEKFMACDLDKIERIILNLLSNAIKFTRPGDRIEVNFQDGIEYVKIIVADTGIGIPEDKKDVIFERFKQVDKSFTRKHEGSGIGLALVKSLVEMHGGFIEADSVLDLGSSFTIMLPISEAYEDNNQEDKYEENVERIQVEFSDIYLYD